MSDDIIFDTADELLDMIVLSMYNIVTTLLGLVICEMNNHWFK